MSISIVKRHYVIGLCLALSVVIVSFLVMSSQGRAHVLAPLTLSDHSRSFGTVFEGNGFEWPMRLNNPNETDVFVESFARSCTCVSVEPPSATIKARASADFLLKMDLRVPFAARTKGLAERHFSAAVTPVYKSIPKQTVLAINGVTRALFSLDRSVINLGDLREAETFSSQCATVTPLIPLKHLDVIASDKEWSASLTPKDGDRRQFLRVDSKSPLKAGPIAFDVTIIARTNEDGDKVEIIVPVTGVIRSDFTSDPPALLFGAHKIGSSVTGTITLMSANNAAFRVKDLPTPSAGIEVEPNRLDFANTHVVTIRQDISSVGAQSRRVTLSLLGQDLVEGSVTFPVSYIGVP